MFSTCKSKKGINLWQLIIDAVFAGIMIAIGTAVYLNCSNRIVGAFLFSIGLITINEFGFNLYTGKVGYIRKAKDIPPVLIILIANAVGCLLALIFPTAGAAELVATKLQQGYLETFIRAFVCGILIYICVAKKDKPFVTVIAVPTFILCGAEHSIADICFMFAAGSFSWQSALYILIVVIGNAAGSLLFSLWIDIKNTVNYEIKNYD